MLMKSLTLMEMKLLLSQATRGRTEARNANADFADVGTRSDALLKLNKEKRLLLHAETTRVMQQLVSLRLRCR